MSETAPPGCVFCQIVAGELPAEVLGERAGAIAIRDVSPVAPTHVLIVSRRHLPDATHLDATEALLLGQIFDLANEVAVTEGVDSSGFRLVANVGDDGGKTVDHLHFHVLGGRQFSWPPG